MCHFFSFVVTKRGRILTGDGKSHSGIELGWSLKPDSYREAEWTGESPNKLSVRGIDKSDQDWHKAAVLGKFRTRSELLASITEGRTIDAVYKLKNGKLHCKNGPSVRYKNGSKLWYLNDKLHRKDGPAVEKVNGTKYWYINDKLHRKNGPAIEWADGTKEWWVDGKLYREDGPAVECVDGHKEWWIDGKLHRKDGPAVENANGDKYWYLNGKRHRKDGPAVEWIGGDKEWWINGKRTE
jgi:hypothetical protein